MNKLIIGLTGGIGSGKTAASDWFAEKGICIVDADVVAREVVEPNSPTLIKIAQSIGDWALNENGTLNRKALRDHIFGNPNARKELENIMHPAIQEGIATKLTQSEGEFAILVAPLLLEGNLHKLCHRILVIDTPETTQLERACQRDNQSVEQIRQIIKAQMPRQTRLEKADDVAHNDSTLENLYEQLDLLLTGYSKLASAYGN